MRAEIARKEESYEWRIHALTEKERELKSRLEQTEMNLADERSSRAQAQAPLVEETIKLREVLREVEEQSTEFRNEARQTIAKLEKEKRELSLNLETLSAEKDKMKDEWSIVSQKLARQETKLAESVATAELMSSETEELREECNVLKAKNRKLKEEVDRLRTEQSQLKEESSRLKQRIKENNTSSNATNNTANHSNISNSSAKTLASSSSPDVAALKEGRSILSGSEGMSFTETRLEREVKALQDELVRCSMEAKDAEMKLKGMQELERMFSELGARHAMALEMLGEKETELKLLQEELVEIRQHFRNQIIALSPSK